MQKTRELGTLPHPFGQLHMFTDLSQHTLSCRRQLKTIIKSLCNNHIQYQLIAPDKISIAYKGAKYTVISVKKTG